MRYSNRYHRGDYGGMDVYVTQLLGSGKAHDLFYTDATVIVSTLFLVS